MTSPLPHDYGANDADKIPLLSVDIRLYKQRESKANPPTPIAMNLSVHHLFHVSTSCKIDSRQNAHKKARNMTSPNEPRPKSTETLTAEPLN